MHLSPAAIIILLFNRLVTSPHAKSPDGIAIWFYYNLFLFCHILYYSEIIENQLCNSGNNRCWLRFRVFEQDSSFSVICSGTFFLLVVYWASLNGCVVVKAERKGLKSLAKDINWDIILFMLSIFLVVQGLKNAGVTELLADAFVTTSALPSVLGIIAPSLMVTGGASFMNNWPMTILGLLSIKQAALTVGLSGQALTGLVFLNIIGNNLGPHFFPLGSLAILMCWKP